MSNQALPFELCVTSTEHTKLISLLSNPRLTPEEVSVKMDELLGKGTYTKQVELRAQQGNTSIKVVEEVRQRFQRTQHTPMAFDGKRRYE